MKIKILPIDEASKGLEPTLQLKAITNALEETSQAIKVDYNVTTATWKRRPTFTIKKVQTYIYDIYTDNEIYGYVSEGTKPHRIVPVNAASLAFPANYAAKTTPRVIASRPGGSSGPTVFSKGVMHPGFPGRDFPEVINDKWEREWPAQLQRAINSVIM